MAIELEVGKRYVTREGTEYTEPLKQLTDSFFRDFVYLATTYKIDTEISIATRTWTHDGSWAGSGENDLDLVAEYNPEEIKMEENQSVTTFTTQQKIYKHLANGGYVSRGGVNIFGFTEEGTLATFNNYGEFNCNANLLFTEPSEWKVATLEPKSVSRWENALKDKSILCKVGYSEDDLFTVALIHDILSDTDYPYESVEGQVYTLAVPLTLEEVANYIYECE
jgi:hypothetical protein